MILSTKLKNAFKKTEGNYKYSISNITVNGAKRGCSGFIRNLDNNLCVYINTEPSVFSPLPPLMYRFAENEKDYRGFRNEFADNLEELVENVSKMLNSPSEYKNAIRV